MFLADFGADVIKVEKPGTGDEFRSWGYSKNDVGLYYKVVNRNKRGVTADLRTPLGVEIVKRLTTSADILIESYRPGTLERWGIGWDVLSTINPRLIMLRISGFGQTGPNAPRPGFGTLAEAYSGFAYINGFPDLPPLLPEFALADSTTGLMGAFLAMVALKGRDANDGRGQFIDLALYEALFTLLGPQAVNFDQLGLVQERSGGRSFFTAPRHCYRTKDGHHVAIVGASQATFERMCDALDMPELVRDARFVSTSLRIANNTALNALLAARVEQRTLGELLHTFEACEAAVAPVNNIAQVFADAHITARQNILAVDDDELGGPVRFQNVAGKLSATPGVIRHAGPRLGSHNREILVEELGFTEAELGLD